MNGSRLVKVLAAVCLLLLPLGAAAQIPGLGKVLKIAEEQKPWSAEQEKAIGEATAAKLIAIFGLYEEPRAVKYLNLVGLSVSQFAPRAHLAYRFGILDTEIVNALACPGGYIFVTRGLLANVEDEAELAGVLGHEIIHASERHLEKELRKRKLAALGIKEATEEIPVAELANLADRGANVLLTSKLSRKAEEESDSKGLELAAAVGYDPAAYVEFLAVLEQASQDAANQRFLGTLTASHPKFADRIQRLQKLIADRAWDKEQRSRLSERFQANVVFGAAPAAAEAAPAVPGPPPQSAPAAPPQPAQPPTAAPRTKVGSTPAAPAPPAPAPAAAPPPAPSAAGPAPGSAEWDFGFRPFSADQITTDGKKQTKVKIYARENMFRFEGEEKGQPAISIMRFDRNLLWSLVPGEKMYAEIPLRWGRSFSEVARDPKAKVEREALGTEPVGPYSCKKYRVRVTYEGNVYSGIQWAAEELEGFVVKMLDEKTKTVVEYQNVRLGPPDPALFEPPPGYQKLTIGGPR